MVWMADFLYATHPQGIMVVLFLKIKYPVQDEEYNYHDALQAHLKERIGN